MKIENLQMSDKEREMKTEVFQLIDDRDFGGLQDFLEKLTPEEAIRLPLYYDEKDKGRNLIHKCTHLSL